MRGPRQLTILARAPSNNHHRRGIMCRFTTIAIIMALSTGAAAQGIVQLDTQIAGKCAIVDARSVWTSSHLYVNTGDTIMTYSWGIYSSLLSSDVWWGPAGQGANGGTGFPVPTASAYSLVGRLGSRPGFYVGTRMFFVNTGSPDTLYLGINDITNWNDNYGYLVTWIGKVHNGTVLDTPPAAEGTPSTPSLSQNFPNPFNPQTTIQYSVVKEGVVEVGIYDINGQLVREYHEGQQLPGHYSLLWDGKNESGFEVASGTYFYQIRAGDFLDSRKMLLLR
jgi:hypothetical protein